MDESFGRDVAQFRSYPDGRYNNDCCWTVAANQFLAIADLPSAQLPACRTSPTCGFACRADRGCGYWRCSPIGHHSTASPKWFVVFDRPVKGCAMRRHSHKPNWCVRRFLQPPPRQGLMVQARSHVVQKNKQLRIVAPHAPAYSEIPPRGKPRLGCRPDHSYRPVRCGQTATRVAKRQRSRRLGSLSRGIA